MRTSVWKLAVSAIVAGATMILPGCAVETQSIPYTISASGVSPNPAKPGQVVTVATSLTPTTHEAAALVVFWYNDSSHTLLGRSGITNVNLVAGQAIPLTATFTIPSSAASGTYGVSGTVYQDSTAATVVQTIPTFATFTVGGSAASCTFNGETIASGSSVTAYMASSVPAGQSCVSQVRTCNSGTLSGSYTFSSCSIGSSGGLLKWHPGPYIWLDHNQSQSTQLATVQDIADNCSGCLGFVVSIYWGDIETSLNTYTSASIDPFLQKALSSGPSGNGKRNLRVILRLETAWYGKVTAANPSCSNSMGKFEATYAKAYPDGGCYLAAPNATGGAGGGVRVDEAEIMDRLIALSGYLASKYDANPYVEMYDPMGESSVALPISKTGYETQAERFLATARSQWPHTQIRWELNYWDSDAVMSGMLQFAVDHEIIVGGPDTAPDVVRNFQTNWVWRGYNSPSCCNGTTTSTLNPAFSSFLGLGAWLSEVEQFDEQWCRDQNCTLQGIQDSAHDTAHNNYIMWFYNTYQGGSAGTATQWAAEKAFINAGHSAVYSTACPKSYKSGCNTN
jgi:hypothetical protein